jgi:hypothetical protein
MHFPKYIVVDNAGLKSMVIFGPEWQHDVVAKSLGRKVLSAGFIDIESDAVLAFGESVSLDIKSNPTIDTPLAAATLNLPR